MLSTEFHTLGFVLHIWGIMMNLRNLVYVCCLRILYFMVINKIHVNEIIVLIILDEKNVILYGIK